MKKLEFLGHKDKVKLLISKRKL